MGNEAVGNAVNRIRRAGNAAGANPARGGPAVNGVASHSSDRARHRLDMGSRRGAGGEVTPGISRPAVYRTGGASPTLINLGDRPTGGVAGHSQRQAEPREGRGQKRDRQLPRRDGSLRSADHHDQFPESAGDHKLDEQHPQGRLLPDPGH